VVARGQLRALGFTDRAIDHRIRKGRLRTLWRGVYAVGRPELTAYGRWMAAVLRCGPEAVLSHESAAGLWGIRHTTVDDIEVSVPAHVNRKQAGITVHRRVVLDDTNTARHLGIPVTTPVCTLIDLAARLDAPRLEAAINEADKRDLTDPEALRAALDGEVARPGIGILRRLLDARTFVLTASELERRFLPIARRAGLPKPETRCYVNGFEVDFHWPELGLVIETDGLRYHRTPAQQARDRLRDQAHVAAGLTPLRFTHAQIRFQAEHVRRTLEAVARRLLRAPARSGAP
jgi:very-short-patch-repair endonuclease